MPSIFFICYLKRPPFWCRRAFTDWVNVSEPLKSKQKPLTSWRELTAMRVVTNLSDFYHPADNERGII